MIHVGLLHDEVRRDLNVQHNEIKQTISAIDIDGYLNKAIALILENYSTILQRNRVVGDALRKLEVSNKKLERNTNNNLFTSFRLPTDHYSTISRYAIANVDDCADDRIFLHTVKSDQIQQSLVNSDLTPDFNWRESFCHEASDNVNVYHNQRLIIKDVYIDYLKAIPKVYYVGGIVNGSYILSDGTTIQEDNNLMLDNYTLAYKFCEVATYMIKRDFDENYKVNLETILFTDKLFI